MRILFIGDYSNLHATLAKELRKQGHHADIMSDGCGHMSVETDIFLDRGKGIFGGARYLYDLFTILPKLKDYDVVQLINPNFLSLRPGKIKYFFDKIKAQNRSVFLTLAGNDHFFVKACNDAKLFRFSEFKVGQEPTEFLKECPNKMYGWLSRENKWWNSYLYDNIDGGMAVLPEYYMAAVNILKDKLVFTNLPIDLSSLSEPDYKNGNPVKLFIGMRKGYELSKGTRRLLTIAKDIERGNPGKVIVENVSNLSFKDYISRMATADIVLDQLYSYSPGMNALYAMALGKVVASGGQPEYYDMLGEKDNGPIFSISPLETDIAERLVSLIDNPLQRETIAKDGREWVEKHNDASIVTSRFLTHWNKILNN